MTGQERALFLRGMTLDWDAVPDDNWLRGVEAVASVSELTFHQPVTFFVGENGSGKSTLLEAIAVAAGFNPEGGSRNYRFSTYDSHSGLHDAVRLIRSSRRESWGWFFRAESFYNVATAEEFYSRGPGGNPQHYHERSHGESFLTLMRETFSGDGLFLLDEPEAALSPQRQLTVLLEIARCAAAGAQFLIATHSPILLGLPDAEILSFDGGRIHGCAYEDTESYRVTEMFIRRRGQILRQLLDETE